ncbi:MAG: 30S ribosomal protein S30e [Candidatus Methanomethylicia archaeon]|jgi:small subunit ribosomal protein S30e|uniref:30S ribosomal protein S30e n=1 Tax=Thermoproteota archaeon TaxID=2056631 RepID=A0A520KFK9_9CREN|nr:30S ribosomal protein S30e [Candidatus Methanomethylicia archaeon]MCQ5340384.1 30S ribosomal protein S30e [Candidatus Methanomethylicia archaeon]NHV45415.1 30S ribosomal protein S30e [Candidatus Verstraetearchaeota archaeon]RZN56330.1 MAG: 30S ribosomal protein S30e [Candidatus Verstraetearchaeota archaeon]TDA39989.1 MAG: 30S ribosomal protein S30e [Candidatus Verstraetearchaeota archaeon]
MPSHGSLTKAGKVRSQTPKIPAKERKGLRPIHRNKRNYIRRILYAKAESSTNQ